MTTKKLIALTLAVTLITATALLAESVFEECLRDTVTRLNECREECVEMWGGVAPLGGNALVEQCQDGCHSVYLNEAFECYWGE